MSSSDRRRLQGILAELGTTSIPATLLALRATELTPPAACEIHVVSATQFDLFVYWTPHMNIEQLQSHVEPDPFYVWLDASLGETSSADSLRLSYSHADVSSASALETLRTHIPLDFYSGERASCTLERDGALRLVGS